jgi:hypothetical protein
MLETGEDATLLEESRYQTDCAPADHLDGYALLELTIGALGKINFAHTTVADLTHDAKRADALRHQAIAGVSIVEQRCTDLSGWRLEKTPRPAIRVE